MKNNNKIMYLYLFILFIIIFLVIISSQLISIEQNFIIIKQNKNAKIDIKNVISTQLNKIKTPKAHILPFSYFRLDNRQQFSSTNDTFVKLIIDIDKQHLYEKEMKSNKIEYIKIPSYLKDYRMIYAKECPNHKIVVYFTKNNLLRIVELNTVISNGNRFSDIAIILSLNDNSNILSKTIKMLTSNCSVLLFEIKN